MSGFPINPPRAPVVDAQGNCTPEWYRYFAAVQRIIGGPSDPFDDNLLLAYVPPVDPRRDDLTETAPLTVPVVAQDDVAPPIQHNNSVVTDYIDLPVNGPHVTQARRIQWNEDDGTIDVGLNDEVTLQVGQETHYFAKNDSGGTIDNGTPVMFTGTVGASGKLKFGKAIADGSIPSSYMMGVATESIANNVFGYVTSFGLVRGFNTTGTPYGEVWADGDLLYFSDVTPGAWTNIQPVAPSIGIPVAVVVHAASGGSGSIFVRMELSHSLDSLQDVALSSPADGNILRYVAANSRWENVASSAVDPWTYIKLASDYSTTSDTSSDITGLAITPAANTTYEFEALVMVRTTSTTVGPRVGFVWPTGMTDGVADMITPDSGTTATAVYGNISASRLAAVGGLPDTTSSYPVRVRGMMIAGATPSGSFKLRLASETLGTSVSAMTGSFLKYRVI